MSGNTDYLSPNMQSVSIFKDREETETGGSLRQIAARIDGFEGYRHPHAARIAILADAAAQKFHLAAHDRQALRQAALLHDIGEMAMSRDYIGAERRLNEREQIDLQRHPVIGEQLAAKRDLNRAVQLLIRWHHEWWNGTGYPDALRQEQIPLAARILRVADTYAALTDFRPYNSAVTTAEARRYLLENAAIEFDPAVVKVFLALDGLPELHSFAVASREESPAETRDENSLVFS